MKPAESEGVESMAEHRIERNVLVAGAAYLRESGGPLLMGVLITLLLVGAGWVVSDYRVVRERALHGEHLWEWVQAQNAQQKQVQVQSQGTPAPKAEEKK